METRWGDREARRRDIVAAGRSLLRDHGLSALQMREVARRAGIALGTVYSYFPTKESLYSAMYAERIDEFACEIESVLERTDDVEQVFTTLAIAYRDMYDEFGSELDILSIARAVDGSVEAVSPELLKSAASIWLAVRTVVVRTGARDPDLSLTVLWSTVTGLAEHFAGVRHELHRYSYEQAVGYAMGLLVTALRAEAEPT